MEESLDLKELPSNPKPLNINKIQKVEGQSNIIAYPIELPALFTSLSGYAWPILLLIVILIFKKKIEGLIDRISKFDAFGGYAEFKSELNNFQETVNKVQEMVDIAPKEKLSVSDIEVNNNDFREIINISKEDPSLGIMKLSTLIEKEVRQLVASMGLLSEINLSSLRSMLKHIEDRHALAKSITMSIDSFLLVRNRVVHGAPINKNEIISAVDIGLNLLKAIRTIPHQKNIVSKINVSLYSDPDCLIPLKGIKGVILDSFDNSGRKAHTAIFPTTKNHFLLGKQVAWEWNMKLVIDKTWYRNEQSQIKEAWHQSAEFTGRNIEDI